MKAIAVRPGEAGSIHLAAVPLPALDDIGQGYGVLARVIAVGVDATDREINAAEYAAAPPGADFLVLGHESLCRVEAVGPQVKDLVAGDLVVFTVRRSGTSVYDQGGRARGLDVVTFARARMPFLNGELVEQVGARYVSAQEMELKAAAAALGNVDLIIEATGHSPLVFEAMERLGKNGVLVLTGIAGGDTRADAVHADHILQGFVLGNKVVVGSVNAARQDFERGVLDLVMAQALWPEWLGRPLTHRIDGLEAYEEMIRVLRDEKRAVKVFVQVSDL